MRSKIIAGVDFGATNALAVIDFDGRLTKIWSKKNAGATELIHELSDYPITIVAADTNPPSHQAKKVAACFHARLYYPKHSLSFEEKIRLASTDGNAKNSHERDALAAAKKAFHAIAENKVRWVKKKLCEKTGGEQDACVERVLQGERLHDLILTQ